MIINYIKKNKKIAIFYVFAVAAECLIMYLGQVKWDVVIYSIVMISFVGMILASYDYFRYCRKINELKRDMIPERFGSLEAEYVAFIERLKNEINSINIENTDKRREMMDFYTMWVHQIKTPIAALNLLLQDEEVMELECHKELENELFKIEQYVEMVLSYLRSESDSTDYVFEKCNLENIAKQAVRKYAKQFIRKRLNVELAKLNVVVITDEKWLLFVIEQLLSNALKYTKEGKIKIFVNEMNELVIEDTGIGISKEDLPRVFENGYTGYNGRMDKKSTGIGLYLCRNILKKIGGSIRAESEINVGTKMIISIENEKIDVR